jgi:hypothetical protein
VAFPGFSEGFGQASSHRLDLKKSVPGKIRNPKIKQKKDFEQITQSPFQLNGYGRDQKLGEIDDSSK